MEKFDKCEEPEETIRSAMEETLDENDLVTSMTRIDALHSKEIINDGEKFGLLRNIAMQIPEMYHSQFTME